MTRKLLRALLPALLAVPVIASAAPKTFVMVPKGVHPYYEPCYEGFQAAAKKYGIQVEKVDPQKFELPLQVKVIEDLIAQRVDGIAISALDDQGLVPVIADATKAGIKVITFDADAKSSARLQYIGTNNEAAGTAAGKKMAELMKGQGNLVILQGGLGASNLNERTAGFKKAIAGTRIKLLEVTDVAGDFSVATNKTEALLQTYPDLTAIFAVSAEGAPAAAQVLKQQGKAGKILLAGFDDLKDTLEGIRTARSPSAWCRRPSRWAGCRSRRCSTPARARPLPKVTDTGVLFVTKAERRQLHGRDEEGVRQVALAVPRRARGVAVARPPPARLRGERPMDAIRTVRENRLLSTLLTSKESAIFIALVIIMTVIGVYEPRFLSGNNLYLVSRQISFVYIVALGELFVILTGGIDLSVGSVMALAGMAAACAMRTGVPPPLAVLVRRRWSARSMGPSTAP